MNPAAGGVVIRDKKIVIILGSGVARSNGWTWPKGKVEDDEGLKAGALREVREETGFKTSILAYLGPWKNKRKDKINHYFLLKFEKVVGKPDWEVEKVEWVTFAEAKKRLSKSITAERELWVLKKAKQAARFLELI